MARLPRLLAPLLLFAGVVGLYAPSLGNGFVHDDHEVFLVQPPPQSAAELLRVFAEPHFRGLPYYRPVTRATLLAQRALHGERAAPYRLLNVALAGLAALLACALLQTPAFGIAREPALAAAALFALHPVASSCVYPIASGRETLLPVVLMLAALLAWLRGRHAAAFAGFALALFAKEQAVVVPALFLLADALGLSHDAPPRRLGAWLRRYAPAAAILALYGGVRLALFGGSELRLAILEEPLGPLLSLAYGLQTALLPFRMLAYEPETPVWFSPPRLLLSATFVVALALCCRRLGAPPARVVAFWLGWFVLAQLPTANWLFQEARFAERYTFLALLGPLAIVAGAASAVWSRPRVRLVGLGLAAGLCALAASLSVGRAATFHDDTVFALQWLRSNPDSPDANHLRAVTLVLGGRPEQALPHFRAALRRSPSSAELHHNLGTTLAMLGRDAEARAALRDALSLDPEHREAMINMGQLLGRDGREEEALDYYRAALRLAPRDATAHHGMGTALARRGEWVEAAAHLSEAVRLRPDYAEANRNLGLVRLAQGDERGAAEAFRAALAADPSDAEARGRLEHIEGNPSRP